jgi:hypothetical protein
MHIDDKLEVVVFAGVLLDERPHDLDDDVLGVLYVDEGDVKGCVGLSG